MILSSEYTLILYQKHKYYGESVNPVRKNFARLNDIMISDSFDNEYWLYEIKLTQVEEFQSKNNKKQIVTNTSIIQRVRLGDILI